MSEDDIAQRLHAEGVTDTDVVIRDQLHMMQYPAGQLADDRWVWVPTLIAGRVFTHRLTADEVARDILAVTPDLDPITHLCEHEPYRQLADGGPLTVAIPGFDDDVLEPRGIPDESVPEGGVLVLPPGTLAALGAAVGDVVGVRLSPRGIVIDRVTVTAAQELGARLAAMVADEPVHVDAAVWTLCLQDPALFVEPAEPLSEVIDECGLAFETDLLAPAGFDFEVWRFELQCQHLALRHDIDPDDASAVWMLVQMCGGMSALLTADVPEEPAAAVPEAEAGAIGQLSAKFGGVLADPVLAAILVDETVGHRRVSPAALGLLAETMEPTVPRAARVACRWLQAVALEQTGDVVGAEQALLAAESMDTEWPLTLMDLARFAADRGDAERGLALLRRAGAEPDDPLVNLLEQFRPTSRSDMGRNEPCWCGSGRKYKKCHLGNEQLPLPERATWLYVKATQHVLLTDWNDVLAEVADERTAYDDDPDALDDPLMMDAVLFEGGAFEDFLAVRGFLLPDDERLLAEQWLLSQRSVFEVEKVHPGRDITLRDVRTGDTHQVVDRMASRQLKPGYLVCTRLLSDGNTLRFLGGLEPVALHQRNDLIELLDSEPGPEELVAFLSARFAPPTLTNTEGHPLVFCEATVRVGAPGGLAAALDDAYERGDGEQWHEQVTTHGMQRIRATLSLEDDILHVETNSEARMDDVLAALSRLAPDLTVVEQSRRPAEDIRELAEHSPNAGEQLLDPQDPEVAQVMDELIRTYEANWLDESIPALDGYTPRQAADDPTRRGDLIKLLDSFPATPGGMSAQRLREALDLD
jgi:hypothetical protein